MSEKKTMIDENEKNSYSASSAEQDELTIEKKEIYEAIRRNSYLDRAEYHFGTEDGSNKLKCVHFPEECFIDPDLHGDVIMVDFGEICKPIDKRDRARVLKEYIEWADGDEEMAKQMMKDEHWEDEFIDIPEKIRIDVDEFKKLKVLE